MSDIQGTLVRLLRWSERYTKTDMVYLAESGFWLNLSTIILSGASFFLYIVFAHVLPKDVYGTYQYYLSLATIITSFTLTGINLAVTQAVSRGFEGTFRASLSLQIRVSALALLASLLGALYYLFEGNAEIAKAMILIGLMVPIMTTFNTFSAYLNGKKEFRALFGYTMIAYIPLYILLGVAAFFYADALVLLAINLGVQALLVFLVCIRVLSTYAPSDQSDPEALRFGVRLSVLNFFGTAVGQLDNVLAFHYLGPVQLAVYAFATAIPERVGGLLKFVSTAALPKFSVRPASEIRSTILGKAVRVAFAALLAAILYALAAPYLFAWIFPQYVGSVPFSQLYALTILAYAGNIFVTAMISHRYIKEYALFNVGTSIAQTVIQFAGILYFGLWGLIVAKIASNLLMGVVAGALFLFGTEHELTEESR